MCTYTNSLLSTKSLSVFFSPLLIWLFCPSLNFCPHIPWCFSQFLSLCLGCFCAGKTQSFTSAEWDWRILGTTPVWRRTRWAEKTPPATSASKAVRAPLFPSLQMAENHRRPPAHHGAYFSVYTLYLQQICFIRYLYCEGTRDLFLALVR